MNRSPRLSKSDIEYLDYAWNFASGCTKDCSHCWAKKTATRFHQHYPNGFEPTLYPEALPSPLHLKKPSVIGCVFMGDLFDPAFDPRQMLNVPIIPGLSEARPLREYVFRIIEQCPQHQFLFLTKQAQNLQKWEPFPDNCWVGVTITNNDAFYHDNGVLTVIEHVEAKVKYISFEPLLEGIHAAGSGCMVDDLVEAGINWVIIGAQTKPTVMPKVEWVREIVEAADEAGIPVFLKDSLKPLFAEVEEPGWLVGWENCPGELRQEMPA